MDGSEEPHGPGWREHPEGEEHSWGKMSDKHWSRARADENREAIEHMRKRSRAPGVAEGGGARNHYCMSCDGVIPFETGTPPEVCPHCGAELDEHVKAMFNWVEIDEAPSGDAAAVMRLALAGLAVVALICLAAWWIFR